MKNIINVCLFLIINTNLFAQSVSYNEEFIVNSNTYGNQYNPSISKLDSGKFIITWREDNVKNKGQIFDSLGNTLGGELTLSRDYSTKFAPVKVKGFLNGNFIVIWRDDIYSKIKGKIFSESGIEVTEEFDIAQYEDERSRISYFAVDRIENNKIAITWCEFAQKKILVQILDQNGSKIENGLKSFDIFDSEVRNMDICGISNGGFVVSFSSSVSVFAKIFNNKYELTSTEISIPVVNRGYYDVENLLDGGFIISWRDIDVDTYNYKIVIRYYNENGDEIHNEVVVYPSEYKSASNLRICELSENKMIVYWLSREHWSSNYLLVAQLIGKNGSKIGNEFIITKEIVNPNYYRHNISSLSNGNFVICWTAEEKYGDGSYDGILAKYYLGHPIEHEFTDFEVLEPEYDVIVTRANPQFKWREATDIHKNFPWELTYDLYIDTDEAFSNPIIYRNIQDTLYRVDSLASGQTYFWHVFAKTYYGETKWSSNVNGFYIDENATDVDEEPNQLPDEFKLFQNYPNPFNPTTVIKYSLSTGQSNYHVVIKVYDVLGRLVKELVNTNQQPGNYEVEFNPSADGKGLTSGIYFYSVQAGEFVKIKKMLLLR